MSTPQVPTASQAPVYKIKTEVFNNASQVNGLKKQANGKALGIALTVLGGLAILGAAGLITFTVMRYSPASSAFKGMVGGGAGLTVLGIAGIGTGAFCITKSYWEDPAYLNKASIDFRQKVGEYSFERIMDEFPNSQLKYIVPESVMLEKFVAYLKSRNPAVKYSQIVNSFYPVNDYRADRQLNRWGAFRFEDSYIPRSTLAEFAIEEINENCKRDGKVAPDLIDSYFAGQAVANPIREKIVSLDLWKSEFENEANTRPYKYMLDHLVNVVPVETLRRGLMHQFKQCGSNFLKFLQHNAVEGEKGFKTFYSALGLKIIVDARNREEIDPNHEQLFISDIREAAVEEVKATQMTCPEIVNAYGEGIDKLIENEHRLFIFVRDLEKDELALRYDQLDTHFHPNKNISQYTAMQSNNPIVKAYVERFTVALAKTVVRQLQAMGNRFSKAYFAHGTRMLVNGPSEWDWRQFQVKVDEATRICGESFKKANNTEDATVAEAQRLLDLALKPYNDKIAECNRAISDYESDYKHKKNSAQRRIDAEKSSYDSALFLNEYKNVVFSTTENLSLWELRLDNEENIAVRKAQEATEQARVRQLAAHHALQHSYYHHGSHHHRGHLHHNSGTALAGAVMGLTAVAMATSFDTYEDLSSVRSKYQKKRENLRAAFARRAVYAQNTLGSFQALETLEREYPVKRGKLNNALAVANTTLQRDGQPFRDTFANAKYDAAKVREAIHTEAARIRDEKYKEIDDEFENTYLKPQPVVPAAASNAKAKQFDEEKEQAQVARVVNAHKSEELDEEPVARPAAAQPIPVPPAATPLANPPASGNGMQAIPGLK